MLWNNGAAVMCGLPSEPRFGAFISMPMTYRGSSVVAMPAKVIQYTSSK
ncbi:Uncharacterised protein [Mycobacteroides abscessus subsp. abscessus]|nr:Uncharacterised protein [Mycobacteroides abscessus subsp. abscessus]